MTEEEKKAIERLWSSITDVMFCCLYSQEECDDDKRIALDLIKKQQAEIEKKDKTIKEMAYEIANTRDKGFMASEIDEIINEFERKVEE